jgi:chromosome segregation ATPase
MVKLREESSQVKVHIGRELYRMEGTAVNKSENFSIWDSVVADKITLIENLEKKCQDRGRIIEELETEVGILNEQMATQGKKSSELQAKNQEYEEQIQSLRKERDSLKAALANMENSTCWKMTKPVRVVLDRVRNNH